jgi:hypothetical protein
LTTIFPYNFLYDFQFIPNQFDKSFSCAKMSGLNENKRTLTVKIQLPENFENILAVNFPNTFNVGSLKEDIARKFKISGDQLAVFQNEDEIEDKHMLCHLNLNDFGIIEIKLKLTDDAINDGITLDTAVYYSSFTLPDIITVHVPIENEDGEATTRDLVVEIENKSIKKPFLGGFVHKKTSKIENDVKCNIENEIFLFSEIEYHHAFTQTGPAMEQIQKIKENIICRETQTIELRRAAIVRCHGDVKITFFIQFSFSPRTRVTIDQRSFSAMQTSFCTCKTRTTLKRKLTITRRTKKSKSERTSWRK